MPNLIKYISAWLIIKRKELGIYLFPKSHGYSRFIILCSPRSGSNWLHTLLNSSSEIISKGEILREANKAFNNSNQTIDELVFCAYPKNINAVGLKVFYEYFDDEAYNQWIQKIIDDKSIKVIHLRRNNLLAQYISLKKAELSGVWSSSSKVNSSEPVHIDRIEYDVFKSQIESDQNRMISTFKEHPFIEIEYEEMIKYQANSIIEIQKFLGLRPRKLFSLLHKQSGSDLKGQILNSQDFVDLL